MNRPKKDPAGALKAMMGNQEARLSRQEELQHAMAAQMDLLSTLIEGVGRRWASDGGARSRQPQLPEPRLPPQLQVPVSAQPQPQVPVLPRLPPLPPVLCQDCRRSLKSLSCQVYRRSLKSLSCQVYRRSLKSLSCQVYRHSLKSLSCHLPDSVPATSAAVQSPRATLKSSRLTAVLFRCGVRGTLRIGAAGLPSSGVRDIPRTSLEGCVRWEHFALAKKTV
ncbi:uncharacterized protein LOC144044829 [Vanacampus margaritifer]